MAEDIRMIALSAFLTDRVAFLRSAFWWPPSAIIFMNVVAWSRLGIFSSLSFPGKLLTRRRLSVPFTISALARTRFSFCGPAKEALNVISPFFEAERRMIMRLSVREVKISRVNVVSPTL